ncbi:MAG TPA: CRISPR-associated ring nuclease Csm6 [Candidatus Competibacteraceae bacterium]|nr:CRISPR-associated ring nuclease Csm6 [Candidatus Competibacteraceae bacterium]HRZ06841.1 CRISPR-associated ring nuclease Csm6 [Candidatus Competibacteraceae bacterium]HSA45312.1 CRISPR-associated ring nuclease Csm6 [Candidatus Competibacteraceae bacterium]
MHPEQYSRRILLCVSGLSPQIVTETLYALTCVGEPRFVPNEIHLLTTADGAEQARLTLLSKTPGWFQRLREDHGLPDIRFTLDSLHILHDANGRPLRDIREVADNEAIADAITAKVREFTADPDCAIHASIAGGRKTMGFYLGYALSLFGRPQDRLSHVLVSSPFESNADFFYPTPQERVIYTREGQPLDASDATVMLADIPFVRLRDGLQEALLEPGASFSAVVVQAQRNLAAPGLMLDRATCRVRCGETVLRLTPISFAWLAWFARRALEGLPAIHHTEADFAEFLAEYRALTDELSSEYERAIKALSTHQPEDLQHYFEQRTSKLKRELVKALGLPGARPYLIQGDGRRPRSRYALRLEPQQIHFSPAAED